MTTKLKLLCFAALLLLTSCSLFFNPRAAVKSFLSAAEKGDVDKMTALFSKRAIEHFGIEKIRSNNESFVESLKRGTSTGGSYQMEVVEQTSIPTGERVAFVYRNKSDSISLVFDLSKEGSAWKIDNIGGPELAGRSEQPTPTDATEAQPVPSPESVETVSPESQPTLKGATISGGVLNGKAVSLPKPPYPPVAKAAKASGTVVVQVLVDENGNVAEAQAVSGHPLLQAASVVAARQAKFTPTKLNGQPVKVKGVVTYNFIPE